MLAGALRNHLVEVVEALLHEIGIAIVAILTAAAGGVHGVLKVHDHFKAAVFKALDGFVGHQQVFFRRGFERLENIQQSGFDDDDGDGNARLVADHELRVGPVLDLRAATARPAEESQLHRSGVYRMKSGGQVCDELIGAGKTDLGIVDAKDGHVLQEADGIGHGDVDIGLLQPVAETGVEELDFYGFNYLHWFLH